MDDVTMPAESVAAQLSTIVDRQAAMAGDIKVVLVRLEAVEDHERRIRALEAVRSKLGAYWAAAAVVGAVIGWVAAYLTRPR